MPLVLVITGLVSGRLRSGCHSPQGREPLPFRGIVAGESPASSSKNLTWKREGRREKGASEYSFGSACKKNRY